MSLFFYLFTLAINLWHRKFVTADASLQCFSTINMILSDEDKILIQSLYLKWYTVKRRQKNFLRNLRGVNKLFKKLRDTGTVNRRPGMADRTVPALKKTLTFFFRSSRSLPLTFFCWLLGEATEHTFSPVKKAKSVVYCGKFGSRSLKPNFSTLASSEHVRG